MMAATADERLRQVATEKLRLDEIDAKYLAVAEAAKADGVGLGARFTPSHRWLSKFAHPTAGLVHGITHQAEACRQLQAVCTTQGIYYGAMHACDGSPTRDTLSTVTEEVTHASRRLKECAPESSSIPILPIATGGAVCVDQHPPATVDSINEFSGTAWRQRYKIRTKTA